MISFAIYVVPATHLSEPEYPLMAKHAVYLTIHCKSCQLMITNVFLIGRFNQACDKQFLLEKWDLIL